MAQPLNETEEVLAAEVTDILALEKDLAQTEAELAQNPQFQAFLQKQKQVSQQIADFWKRVEGEMITHDIKSIKGDWGSITIAERLDWDVIEEDLPPRFFKKAVDKSKLSTIYRLEGKAPKGASPKYTKYITKRIK